MAHYAKSRSAEHLHSRGCLSSAAIAAVQNMRDAEGVSDFEFAIWLQESGPDTEAHGYLSDGVASCSCPPCALACCDFGAFDALESGK